MGEGRRRAGKGRQGQECMTTWPFCRTKEMMQPLSNAACVPSLWSGSHLQLCHEGCELFALLCFALLWSIGCVPTL